MAYACRQCQQVNEKAGACPVCNIPMDIKMQNDQSMDAPVVPAETPAVPEAPKVAPPIVPEEPIAPAAPAKGDSAPPVA